MTFSMIPFLFLAICVFWISAASAARRRGDITEAQAQSVSVWLVLLLTWGIASSWLAISGIYSSPAFYQLLPGLWLPPTPVVLSVLLLLAWPTFRAALWSITVKTPARSFLLVHSLRISAIGGLFKAYHGQLPASFVYPVGIPDFIFGFLSLLLFLRSGNREYKATDIVTWNLFGMGVILVAPILMQLGLPGPLYMLTSQPDARALFAFPMVLAPTLVVTTFLFMNGWHAFVLWRSGKHPSAGLAAF